MISLHVKLHRSTFEKGEIGRPSFVLTSCIINTCISAHLACRDYTTAWIILLLRMRKENLLPMILLHFIEFNYAWLSHATFNHIDQFALFCSWPNRNAFSVSILKLVVHASSITVPYRYLLTNPGWNIVSIVPSCKEDEDMEGIEIIKMLFIK